MKQTLGTLMEGFVALSHNGQTVPTYNGPVRLNDEELLHPVVPMDRWALEDRKRLRKLYTFKTTNERNQFVFLLLQYEEVKMHHAEMLIDHNSVLLRLCTKDIDSLTDLDKEYAKCADILYKDVVSEPVHVY